MNSFNFWKNEVADMPSSQDGEWVDLETGFTYKDWIKSRKNADEDNEKIIKKAKESRAFAKSLGAKALKGTAKQKKWAEEIRKNILIQLSNDEATMIIKCISIAGHAKFWIENRDKSASSFSEFFKTVIDLTKKANEAHAKSQSEECSLIVAEREKILKSWGVIL